MNRIKPYDVPHKGLRNALSQLSLLAGKTDYSDQEEVAQLYNLGNDVFKLLAIHATDENEVTLMELEQRCPGCSQHDIDDHEQIHMAQEKLEKLLAKIYTNSKEGQDVTKDGEEFCLAFSEFHSVYLAHTAEEERITQTLLWQHFTDEELATQRAKIMAKISPHILLIWFRFIFPALSHQERTGLLTGFKKMVPVPFFQEAMQTIQQTLTEREFSELKRSLLFEEH